MNNNISKLTKSMIIIFAIILMPIFSIKVEAKNSSAKTPWVDDSGNIWFQSTDHKSTSKIYYRTVGYTITRCYLGTKTPIEDEYFTIMRTGSIQNAPLGNGFVTTAYQISESEIISRISQNSAWIADKESGEPFYLKIDAIMITINDNYPEPANMSGMLMSNNNQDYFINPLNLHPGVYDKFTKDNLKYNTYGWAYPDNVDNHFDHYLLYEGVEEEEPIIDDEFVYNGKKDVTYYTWNTSDEYDLSKGIPSGEDITNGVEIDAWYGDFSIGKHTVTKQYKITYNLDWYEIKDIYEWKDEDGDGDDEYVKTGEEQIDHTYSFFDYVTKKAEYYYVMRINVYELQKAIVYNSVYPGDTNVFTPHIWGSIPMDVVLDGISMPEQVDNWKQTLEDEQDPSRGHVIFEPNNNIGGVDEIHYGSIQCGKDWPAVEAKMEEIKKNLHDDVLMNDYDPIGMVRSRNDHVEINGKVYLQGDFVEDLWDTTDKKLPYVPIAETDKKIVSEEKTVTIPKDVPNGPHTTSMEVEFKKRVLADDMLYTHSAFAYSNDVSPYVDTILEHIKPAYIENEPVYVLTPVIAPVIITNGEGETQLIEQNKTGTSEVDEWGRMEDGKAGYELLLDGTYTFHFDAAMHEAWKGYGWSGDPSKYDKYVKGKYARFPFDVEMYGKVYQVQADGFTEWIEIVKNDAGNYDADFYITPWAEEQTYCEIEYKVEAYNVLDEEGELHEEDQHPTANDDNRWEEDYENYVAVYNVPVELSGIIYDFEITGCDNYQDYNREFDDEGHLESGSISFAPYKMEKKSGTLNRLGTDSVRYTLDGEITNNWSLVNTLPMAMGTSEAQKDKGYLKLGETFTFSVKTIANLWHDNDYVSIKPSFRFYDNEENCYDDVQVYYWNYDQLVRMGDAIDLQAMYNTEEGNGNNTFSYRNSNAIGSWCDSLCVTLPSERDKIMLYSNWPFDYDGTYHDEDLLYTIQKYNGINNLQWLLKSDEEKVNMFTEFVETHRNGYCMGRIKMGKGQRLFTGNYEQLAVNVNDNPGLLSKTHFSVASGDAADVNEKMKYSMQTWHGNYRIPNDIMVCKADTFEKLGAIDQDGDGVIDLWDYLLTFDGDIDDEGNYVNGIDEKADYWLDLDYPYGYLVLNFDIKTYKENESGDVLPHLQYEGSGGGLDMWDKQGAKEEAEYGDPNIEGDDHVIELEPGDIALINTGLKKTYYVVQDLF